MEHDQTLTAQRMSDLSDDMVTVMSSFVNNEILKRNFDTKEDPKLQNFLNELRELQQTAQRREALIAFIGDMSGGKSSIANMLIGYPMFPVAAVATSEMPAEVRYGKEPKLQVFTYSKSEDGEFQEKNVYTFARISELPDEDKGRLVAYAKLLVNKRLLKCENLDYYYNFNRETEDEITAEANNMIRMLQLMLVPLTASVGRGNPCYEDDPGHSEAIQEQKALLKDIFGVSDDEPFVTRVWLDSGLLKNGLVLVDLPGLGSGNALHTKVTQTYMRRADAFILPFNQDAKTADVQTALGTILKYESMLTGGKDSRFIFVLNKCDDPYEKRPDAYADFIEQAVANIRPGVQGIQVSELIPISAHYAEYRLLEHGVSPSHTMQGRKLKAMLPASTDEQIKEYMLARYQTEFVYYDQYTGRTVAYSTEAFMDKTIGEYAPKIRFLNALRRLYDITAKYGNYQKDVEAQLEMLHLLETCGDQLMRDLLDKMADALKDCQAEIITKLNGTKKDIEDNHIQLVKDLEDAKKSYVDGLGRADDVMKQYLQTEIGKMTRDCFGNVVIDPNAYTSTWEENKRLYDGLINYFHAFNFAPYIAAGNQRLEANLNADRKLYQKGIHGIKDALSTLAITCSNALENAYRDFIKELRDKKITLTDDVKAVYESCYRAACSSILDYLNRLAVQMNREMDTDQRVETEIAVTTGNMTAAIARVEHFYHIECVNYMKAKQQPTTFLERESVNIDAIQKELSKHFRSNDKNKSDLTELDPVLVLGRTCHKERITEAINEAFSYFQKKLDEKLNYYIPHITDDIQDYFDDADGRIGKRYQKIYAECISMSESLTALYESETIQASVVGGKNEVFSQADATFAEKELMSDIQGLKDTAENAWSKGYD